MRWDSTEVNPSPYVVVVCGSTLVGTSITVACSRRARREVLFVSDRELHILETVPYELPRSLPTVRRPWVDMKRAPRRYRG